MDGLMCPQFEHIHLPMRLTSLDMGIRVRSAYWRAYSLDSEAGRSVRDPRTSAVDASGPHTQRIGVEFVDGAAGAVACLVVALPEAAGDDGPHAYL
jgi:hypothetical protein